MGNFLYLEPSEARVEFLLPLAVLAPAKVVEGAPQLDRDARDSLLPELTKRLSGACRVRFDGSPIEFKLSQIGFVTIDPELGPIPDERTSVAADDALVAAIFVAPTEGFPGRLEIEWLLFPESQEEVDVTVEALASTDRSDPDFSQILKFTRDSPSLDIPLPEIATDIGLREVPPVVRKQTQTAGVLPWLFLAACLALLGIALRAGAGDRSPFVIASGIAAVFAVGSFTQGKKVRSVEIPDEKSAGVLVENLLSNVYHAFSYRDESEIYDVLDESIVGTLLEQVYADIWRGVKAAEDGGPTVRVLDVIVIDSLIRRGGDKGGLAVDVAWA